MFRPTIKPGLNTQPFNICLKVRTGYSVLTNISKIGLVPTKTQVPEHTLTVLSMMQADSG